MSGDILTTKEAADYLGVSASMLAKDRMKKEGHIPYIVIGTRLIRYRREDLDIYIKGRTRF